MTTELEAAPELDTALDETPEVEISPVEDKGEISPAADKPIVEPTMEESIRTRLKELGGVPKTDVDSATERDPVTGKFVTKGATRTEKAIAAKEAAPVAAVKPVAPELQKAAETVVPKAPVADPAIVKAPTSWKGTAQAKWEALDPDIKAEVHRREQDFHKGIAGYKRESELFKELDREIQPYAAMLRADNLTPQVAVRDMLNTAYLLKTGTPEGKATTLAQLAQYYSVDLTMLPAVVAKLEAGQPVVDPKIAELEQRLAAVTGSIETEKQEAARQQFAGVVAETQAFAAKNPHYEAVKLDMAALIESGRAESFQDAYDKAIWANPEVRAALLTEQEAARRQQAVATAAAAKKAASTNVATRGTLPSAPAVAGTEMDATIRNAYRKLQGLS
jgi:hypothetical protein